MLSQATEKPSELGKFYGIEMLDAKDPHRRPRQFIVIWENRQNRQWDALIAGLMTLHGQQWETSLDKRRGHRPRLTALGTGRRAVLTWPARGQGRGKACQLLTVPPSVR